MIPYAKIRPFLPYLFWIWLCTILILMLIPTDGVSAFSFPGRDKIIHFGLFFILGFFYLLPRYKISAPFRLSKANRNTFLLLIFSIAVEFLQLKLAYRSFEILDILSNLFGVSSGILFAKQYLPKIIKE
ncbi:MAG: VanZ family protein [Bacteroidales bacterium]|nr:VanZ family protein [Bacteroidales bacterium]